jgi:iron complex outermembrane receptor protein
MKYLLIILFGLNLYAAKISGIILDDNQKPIIGTSISIEGTKYGAIAKNDGSFIISGLKNNNYSLLISSVAYIATKEKVDLINSDSIYLKIVLKENVLRTGEVVVSANKRIQAVQEIPISTSIIQSEDLEIRQMNSLEYALEYVPGVQVTRDNVSIRGSSGFSYGVGSRVALLIDGFPMLAADNGDLKMDALPLFNLKQIEVVKGAGSALYGTSAIGGVVNVLTEDIPEEFQTKYRVYSGAYTPLNYDDWNPGGEPRINSGFDISTSNRFGDLGILLNVGFVDEDSYRIYDKKQLFNSFLKMDYKINENSKLLLNTNISLSENDNWAFWRNAENPFLPSDTAFFDENRISSDKYSMFLGYDQIFNENNFMNLRAGVFYTEYYNHYENTHPEYRASEAFAYSILPQFNSKLSSSLFMTYGLDLRLNRVNSVVYDGNTYQNILAAYTQLEYQHPNQDINITGGLRYDFEDNNDTSQAFQFSPKLGITCSPIENITFRTSGGGGFRAPQIAERYAQINFQGIFVSPNPNLIPERSFSFEVGTTLDNRSKDFPLYLDFAFFQNSLEDLIEPTFDIPNGGDIVFQNISSARIRGLELVFKSMIFGFIGIELSGTYVDPINLTENRALPFRSKYLSKNRVIIPFGDIRFETDYRFNSKMDRIDERLESLGIVEDASFINEAHVFDMRLAYNLDSIINQKLSVTLNIFNVFNYYHTQMVGNMAPTRQINLMIQGAFN